MTAPRVALYACTTAADLGRTVLDEKLPELRRYASVRDWDVVGEYTDATPTGTGRRPGFDKLCGEIEDGRVQVVVANALHDLFWDLTQVGRIAEPWTRAGVQLVCIRNDFDATTELGWREFVYFASRVDEWRRGRMRERQRIGVLRAQMATAGAPVAGRPRVVVNPMEVKAGYERGLSQAEIRERIERAGGHISKGTLSKVISELRDSGQMDERRREAALLERGGLPRGGREAPRGRVLTDQDAIEAYASGASIRSMAAQLRAAGVAASRGILGERLAQLRAAGRLDEVGRQIAVSALRARRARRATVTAAA